MLLIAASILAARKLAQWDGRPSPFFESTIADAITIAESRLESLVAYGCDIEIVGGGGRVPLWIKDSGYDAAGIGLLVQRCTGWYARRRQGRRIEPGDRLAVLGRGIAVVEHADDSHVHLALWNREVLRIRRKDIAWDETNMRWEASPQACAVADGRA